MIIEVTVSREGLAIDPIVIEEMPASKGFAKAALKASKTADEVLNRVRIKVGFN